MHFGANHAVNQAFVKFCLAYLLQATNRVRSSLRESSVEAGLG
jgi:hypothetical protein